MGKEDIDKINLRIDQLIMTVEKNQTVVNVALDTKISMIDLQNVQQTIMDRLNELMRTFDGMFADKEGTRKKFAQLEKAVSFPSS